MKPQVVIIGTGHRLQAGHDSYSSLQLKAFADLLDRTKKKYRIKFIAEEMSSDVLPDFGVTTTVAKVFADRKKLVHRYVDLTYQERAALGLTVSGCTKEGRQRG